MVALAIGATAALSGPQSSFLDAEVLGTSLTRSGSGTDQRLASASAPDAIAAPSPVTVAERRLDSAESDTLVADSVPNFAPEAAAPAPATPAPTPPVAPDVAPAPPPPTPAVAPAPAAAPATLESRVLGRISYPWRERLPGWRIEFAGPRTGYRGSTFPNEKVIQVYVRSSSTDEELAHVAAHEIGHAVDVTYLDPGTRAAFNMARGRAADFGWWVASGADDFASGAGDWAECFAWAQLGSGPWYSRLGPPPDAAALQLVVALATT